MTPTSEGGGILPDEDSDLAQSIVAGFGSMDEFIKHFSAKTAALQGSGWGWLAYNKISGNVEYQTTVNQDRLSDIGAHLVPLLTIDVWEHAYYLDY